MFPLFVLLVTFTAAHLAGYWLKNLTLAFKGSLAMAVMLLFTGIAHFTQTEVMARMLPPFVPAPALVIYGTGLFEMLLGFALLVPLFRKRAALLLIFFLLAILPANVWGSIQRVPLGGMEQGANYLYFRIPLQIFFIAWIYFFCMRQNK